MAVTQRKLIRQALQQAGSMKSGSDAYLKGSDYKNRPVLVTKDGANTVHITMANNSGGTVTHYIDANSSKVLSTNRSTTDHDNRIYGTTGSFRISSKSSGTLKKPSSGHSGG